MHFQFMSGVKSSNQVAQFYGHQLWLGDYSAAVDTKELAARDIKSVLTAAAGLNVQYHSALGINHRTYQALDMPYFNIAKFFDDSFNFLEEALHRGSVLVHCAAGVSRSASIVIAYLMRKNKWSFAQSIDFVRSKRPIICPNNGFIKQLKHFESVLKKKTIQPAKEKDKDKEKEKEKESKQIIQFLNNYEEKGRATRQTPLQGSSTMKPVVKGQSLLPMRMTQQRDKAANLFKIRSSLEKRLLEDRVEGLKIVTYNPRDN